MFSRGFRLAVPDFHQTNPGQIHKKTHYPKKQSQTPPSPIIVGRRPLLLVPSRHWYLQNLLVPQEVVKMQEQEHRSLSTLKCEGTFRVVPPFSCVLLLLDEEFFFAMSLNHRFHRYSKYFPHQIFLLQKKTNSTWKYDQSNTKNLQGATHTDCYYHLGDKYFRGYIRVEPWGTPPGLGTATVRTDPGWTPSWTEVVTLWPEYQVS